MKIVVALGGNALQKNGSVSAQSQYEACRDTAKNIVKLIKEGHDIAIVHGNGPQVGEIVADIELAHNADSHHTLFPFDVCDAFTQGYIGYHLQNAFAEALRKANITDKSAVSVVTQVEVSASDPAFQHPSKPIGSFYDEATAKKLQQENGFQMMEDAGRGWRRVVPSPQPIDIVEKKVIKQLFDSGNLVIACGGGGIPVVQTEEGYQGVEAVIDKDFAAEKLAEILGADILIILTAVDKVYIHFNQPNKKALNKVSSKELESHIALGQFAKGSMLPKIEAVKKFVESGSGKKAVIAALEEAGEVFAGAGTTIYFAGE
ncbi:MAG: carbamate kinase [Gammaproteobacteria bacterium]|nr:carbamate kinase [Gammaproteobacteria bacterium]